MLPSKARCWPGRGWIVFTVTASTIDLLFCFVRLFWFFFCRLLRFLLRRHRWIFDDLEHRRLVSRIGDAKWIGLSLYGNKLAAGSPERNPRISFFHFEMRGVHRLAIAADHLPFFLPVGSLFLVRRDILDQHIVSIAQFAAVSIHDGKDLALAYSRARSIQPAVRNHGDIPRGLFRNIAQGGLLFRSLRDGRNGEHCRENGEEAETIFHRGMRT